MRLLILLLVTALDLGAVTLLWNRNTETNVVGYRIYGGTNGSRMYDWVLDVGNDITGRVQTVQGTMYWFAVTAYDSDGLESGYSAEAAYYRPPYTNSPRSLTMLVPTSKWWIVRGPALGTMTNWYSVTGPTNVVMWSTNGPSMFLARKPFYTSFAKVATKGAGAKAQMTKAAPLRKAKAKTAVNAAPVLGPARPVPVPGPPKLPSPTRTR